MEITLKLLYVITWCILINERPTFLKCKCQYPVLLFVAVQHDYNYNLDLIHWSATFVLLIILQFLCLKKVYFWNPYPFPALGLLSRPLKKALNSEQAGFVDLSSDLLIHHLLPKCSPWFHMLAKAVYWNCSKTPIENSLGHLFINLFYIYVTNVCWLLICFLG